MYRVHEIFFFFLNARKIKNDLLRVGGRFVVSFLYIYFDSMGTITLRTNIHTPN